VYIASAELLVSDCELCNCTIITCVFALYTCDSNVRRP